MHTPIVVMGAAGRMGTHITAFVQREESLRLSALVERPESVAAIHAPEGCLVGDDLGAILARLQHPVIIDFTSPEASLATARVAVEHGAGHVIGTTGLTEEHKKQLEELAVKTPIFWSPNMSVGINVLLKVLPELVRLLGEDYDMELMEIHHNRKKDSPSGTALRMAEVLAQARQWRLDEVAAYHREGIIGERPKKELGIQTLRGGDVVGVHTAYFFGPGERIEVSHQAHSRENFAKGAIRAAVWLAGQKPGVLYTMADLF